jgi:hypothetical protein
MEGQYLFSHRTHPGLTHFKMKNPVGFIQTLGNQRKISKKTRPYNSLGIDCVSPNIDLVEELSVANQMGKSSLELAIPGFGIATLTA